MLTKIHGTIIFECDVCADTLDTDTADFSEAIRTLKNEGWIARRIGADWIHSCAECGAQHH